jgi:DNA-binding PadR family transcriptional regulator
MPGQQRRLQDLISVGPAMLRDFELLGIRSVKQLARRNPAKLYQQLCRFTGQRVDICCQDVFSAAIAQARNPLLPAAHASGGIGVVSERPAMPVAKKPAPKKHAAKKAGLTVPDLVLLSLLAEQPMHGYQANLELERRQVQDWAGVSRPQVYYSLEKLARLGFIAETGDHGPALGPERRIFSTTSKGRAALASALEREDWINQRERPPFLTWMALSWQASLSTVLKQLRRREQFLEAELAREQETLRAVEAEVGHRFHEAVWMIKLVIEQFRTELLWLRQVAAEIPCRASATNSALIKSTE